MFPIKPPKPQATLISQLTKDSRLKDSKLSAQDRAPAYAISLLAGILTFIGGLAKASTSGIIKYTASGATFNNFVGNSIRSTNFGFAMATARICAVILILFGIVC